MFFCALALVFAQLFSETSISCPETMLCDARVPEHEQGGRTTKATSLCE